MVGRMPWCVSSLGPSAVVGTIEHVVQVMGKQPLRETERSKRRTDRAAVDVDRIGAGAGRAPVPAHGPGGRNLRSAGSAPPSKRKEVRPSWQDPAMKSRPLWGLVNRQIS